VNYKQYLPLAVRTLTDLGSRKRNLAHMGLGISSEMLELESLLLGAKNDADTVADELGDLSWFTASATYILDDKKTSFGGPIISAVQENGANYRLELIQQVELVTSLIKKHVAYGQPIVTDNFIGRVHKMWLLYRNKKFINKHDFIKELHKLRFRTEILAVSLGYSYGDILQANINKLAKRYPGGYSDYHAAKRLDKNESNG